MSIQVSGSRFESLDMPGPLTLKRGVPVYRILGLARSIFVHYR